VSSGQWAVSSEKDAVLCEPLRILRALCGFRIVAELSLSKNLTQRPQRYAKFRKELRSPLTAHCSLLTAYCLLLTAYRSLLKCLAVSLGSQTSELMK